MARGCDSSVLTGAVVAVILISVENGVVAVILISVETGGVTVILISVEKWLRGCDSHQC